jgi:hypothetical protein
MKKVKYISIAASLILGLSATIVSCTKDVAPATPATPPAPVSLSMSEEFTDVSKLAEKGWVIKNNSEPIGPAAWRQGVFTNSYNNKTGIVMGFPAYSSEVSPYDFISVDATAVNSVGTVSCWLISPVLQVKNGDNISFWTRAQDDSTWPNYAKDRMQVRLNTVDASDNVGNSSVDTGSFRQTVLEINPTNLANDPGGNASGLPGYLRTWHKRTITVTGFSATRKATRIGLRYFMPMGGINGTNPNSIVGVDQFVFTSN